MLNTLQKAREGFSGRRAHTVVEDELEVLEHLLGDTVNVWLKGVLQLTSIADDHFAGSSLLLETRGADSKVLVVANRMERPGWIGLHFII